MLRGCCENGCVRHPSQRGGRPGSSLAVSIESALTLQPEGDAISTGLKPASWAYAEEFVVEGMKTTVPLHQRIVRDPDFLDGDYTIKWLEAWLEKNAE